jgi:hypothetical protein
MQYVQAAGGLTPADISQRIFFTNKQLRGWSMGRL